MAVQLVGNTRRTSSKRVTARCKKQKDCRNPGAPQTQNGCMPPLVFLELSRKVNIHLCCHSTCIQPSWPHTTRSFLPLLSFFFFTSVLFLYVCGARPHQLDWRRYPGCCSRLRRGRGFEGIAGSSLAATCSPLILQKRGDGTVLHIDDLQRYKNLLSNRCLYRRSL